MARARDVGAVSDGSFQPTTATRADADAGGEDSIWLVLSVFTDAVSVTDIPTLTRRLLPLSFEPVLIESRIMYFEKLNI